MKKTFSLIALFGFSIVNFCNAHFLDLKNPMPCHKIEISQSEGLAKLSEISHCEICEIKIVSSFENIEVKKTVNFKKKTADWLDFSNLENLNLIASKKYFESFIIPMKIADQQKKILRI